jgi:hypothetical protein
MQLFSADATMFIFFIIFFFPKYLCPPKHKKIALKKVAHNPTRPQVFSPVYEGEI